MKRDPFDIEVFRRLQKEKRRFEAIPNWSSNSYWNEPRELQLRQIKTLIFSAQAPLQFADATTTAIPRLRCHRLPSLTSVRMARMAVSRMIAAKQPTPEIIAGNTNSGCSAMAFAGSGSVAQPWQGSSEISMMMQTTMTKPVHLLVVLSI